MLEYVRNLFNDKKTYTIFIATFIVAVFIVLLCVWWPSNDIQEFHKYKDINLQSKYMEIGNNYVNELGFYIRYGQVKEVLDKISNEYLEYVGLTKSQLRDDIFSKKVVAVNKLTINSYENLVIYSAYLIYEDNTTRKINIVESYPYNYVITFDTFFGYKNVNENCFVEGISYDINTVFYGENIRTYDLSITNKTNNRISIDVSNPKKVYLELENGEHHNLNGAFVTNDLENIVKGRTVNKKFEFDIPFSVQSKVSKLVFSDVNIDGKIVDIEIEI